mmetsp:Transcript_6017/g.14578  ORF Transcript_6017/g.14578 Transcript_6017/m.14578 type:complete len:422 (-) Transcript_6017:117-1382(-)
MPLVSMLMPAGVRYLPTVMTSPEVSESSYTDWISPLPYVRLPTRTARQLSCSAPARISLALAVCSFTSSVSGTWLRGGPAAVTRSSGRVGGPLVITTVAPGSRNRRATSTPPVTRPPRLSLRSRTSSWAPRSSRSRTDLATSACALAVNDLSPMYPTRRPSSVLRSVVTTVPPPASYLLCCGRRSSTVRTSPSLFATVTLTVGPLPLSPWMAEETSKALLPDDETPSMARISSPCWIPADSAAEPWISPRTQTPSSASERPRGRLRCSFLTYSALELRLSPTPVTSNRLMLSNSCGVMKRVYGSESPRASIVRMARCAALLVRRGCASASSRSCRHLSLSKPRSLASRKLTSTTSHTSFTSSLASAASSSECSEPSTMSGTALLTPCSVLLMPASICFTTSSSASSPTLATSHWLWCSCVP